MRIADISLAPMLQGGGLDMLKEVLATLRPSHLVQMQSPTASRNLPDDGAWLPAVLPLSSANIMLPAVGCAPDGRAAASQTVTSPGLCCSIHESTSSTQRKSVR